MEVRPATDDDWASIWPFLEVVVRAGETYTWDRATDEATARALWHPAGWRNVVAIDDGRVVGAAKYGPDQGGNGSHVANASFLVDPAAGGRGVGRALGEHVLAAAAADGFRSMRFNAVVEANAPAVHLWQSLGFTILATIPEAFDHPTAGLVGLHLMWRDLR